MCRIEKLTTGFPATSSTREPRPHQGGFTLVELLATVAIIGILAGIAISQSTSVLPEARQEAGIDAMNLLNRGVQHYNQVNSEITIPAASDTTDEVAVLALLKTRSTSAPGSPYIPAEFTVISSNDTGILRMYWTGRFFKAIPEGTTGTGIAIIP